MSKKSGHETFRAEYYDTLKIGAYFIQQEKAWFF